MGPPLLQPNTGDPCLDAAIRRIVQAQPEDGDWYVTVTYRFRSEKGARNHADRECNSPFWNGHTIEGPTPALPTIPEASA